VTEHTSSLSRDGELRVLLHDVHQQLAERDALIERLLCSPDAAERQALEQEREALSAERASLAAEREGWAADSAGLRGALAEAQARIASMSSTRAWRAARLWWKLRDLPRGR
jgi:peptidoglycan hydrolase CwlO-like protein